MTLLAAWIGVDQKKAGPKPCSLYIASDSRISWDNDHVDNMGPKVFGMKNHPDILGYCGDVVFAVNLINQLIGQADNHLLFSTNAGAKEKFSTIYTKFEKSIEVYPVKYSTGSFKVLYGTRDKDGDFHCFRINWNKKDGISSDTLMLPSYSDLLAVEGSGAPEFKERYKYYYNLSKHNNFRTSRTIYHCFTETLANMKDRACGGVPQIVGLYRIKNARFFGVIEQNKKYFMGQEVDSTENLNFVEWRNDLFERYDPERLKIMEAAQRQPKS